MDRRDFLQAALVAASAIGPLQAEGLDASPPPAYPPADGRTVWLAGDGARPSPAEIAAQLAVTMAGSKSVADVYLAGAAVADLERMVASLFDKEDAVFFPTGTMANSIAIRVLCGGKSRAIVQHESHVYADESDATQRLANINLVPLASGRATPTLAEVSLAIDEAEKGRFPVRIGAISIESPVRRVGGEIVPAAEVAAIAALAKARGIGLHLDAARLLLAPPRLDISSYVAPFDTVYLSLYKYLGAPFGAILAGKRNQMTDARELRHAYGGMINQGWIPASIAMDTLKGFSTRIARAHSTAEQLIATLEASGKVRRLPNPNASNIHQLEMSQALADAAFERGRVAGVHLARWKDGAMPIYVNETINRRPWAQYAQLFLS
jgi:threonine aldolase